MKRTVFLATVLLLFAGGCVKTLNPVTGQTEYSIDPNKVAKVDTGIAAAEAVTGGVSILWPEIGIPAMAILTALAGVWRKTNPVLATAATKADTYYNVTAAAVSAIEELKTANPEAWVSLKAELEKAIGPEAENVIRALRGLPAKA